MDDSVCAIPVKVVEWTLVLLHFRSTPCFNPRSHSFDEVFRSGVFKVEGLVKLWYFWKREKRN